MKKFVIKFVKENSSLKKLQAYTKRKLFGFELGVLENVSSRKNISVTHFLVALARLFCENKLTRA